MKRFSKIISFFKIAGLLYIVIFSFTLLNNVKETKNNEKPEDEVVIPLENFAPSAATAKEQYKAAVEKGYYCYSYIVDYENSYYNFIVVEGIVDDKITYGVFFFNDVSRNYYITLVNEQTGLRQIFPETRRGDVHVLGFHLKEDSSYTILIRDKKAHEQNLPFDLSFGLKTREEISSAATAGLSKGVSIVDLETAYWFKPLKINLPALIISFFIALAVASLIVIVYFYRRKKGVFQKKDKLDFDFEKFVNSEEFDDFLSKEIEKPTLEIKAEDITVEEAREDGTIIVAKEEVTKPVYKRYERDVEAEHSDFNFVKYLEKEGLPTDYTQLDDETKNQITLRLMYLKDQNLITVDDYLKEISKLWKS